MFENAIANQLSRRETISYFEKSADSEIDFILDRNIAFEVKETANQFDLTSLTERAKALNIQDCRLIVRYLPENGFKDFTWGGNIF